IGFVPTILAEQLFRADWPAETALRLLLTGGDTLQRRPPARLPFPVINNYGPSECTVVATSGLVSPEPDAAGRPSIGRPIANAKALILDDRLQPVERGEPGELCIGGALVARGYRNMPELTAKQFITYGTSPQEKLRLYRTGDRVRLLDSGDLEFLGRFDDQVKIRGNRVELGEIEACLGGCSEIAASAVSASVAAGGPVLIAHLVITPGAHLTESQAREYVAAKLPDYMVPAFFVSIPSLPLMANGKLDKTALPAPNADNLLPGASRGNERLSALERQLAGLVASLMSRPSIGPDENLFMIGGHSMFGVQLVARIREVFGVKLPLRQVFTAPTVRELSSEVARLISAA
ncbi:MAG: non-ribosomal peptide synthetase, partial [Candidatus Eremiobacteraeota bacterium]|nr:non-ribosomal peptide synthetase [Candidatus Eremiobacteraeota bacterium]